MSMIMVPFTSVSVAAGVTKTIVFAKAQAGRSLRYVRAEVSGDSNVPTDKPVLIEIVTGANAGTGSAATPVFTKAHWTDTPDTTAGHTYTVEPTSLTVRGRFFLHPTGGVSHFDTDIKECIESNVAEYIGLRVTMPAGVTTVLFSGGLWLEE